MDFVDFAPQVLLGHWWYNSQKSQTYYVIRMNLTDETEKNGYKVAGDHIFLQQCSALGFARVEHVAEGRNCIPKEPI